MHQEPKTRKRIWWSCSARPTLCSPNGRCNPWSFLLRFIPERFAWFFFFVLEEATRTLVQSLLNERLTSFTELFSATDTCPHGSFVSVVVFPNRSTATKTRTCLGLPVSVRRVQMVVASRQQGGAYKYQAADGTVHW